MYVFMYVTNIMQKPVIYIAHHLSMFCLKIATYTSFERAILENQSKSVNIVWFGCAHHNYFFTIEHIYSCREKSDLRKVLLTHFRAEYWRKWKTKHCSQEELAESSSYVKVFKSSGIYSKEKRKLDATWRDEKYILYADPKLKKS